MCTLKNEMPSFYDKYFRQLAAATCFLSFPIFIRATLDFMVAKSPWFQKLAGFDEGILSNAKEIIVFNFIHIFGSIFPIFSQLASLTFGYIRRNEKKVVKII